MTRQFSIAINACGEIDDDGDYGDYYGEGENG